MRTGCSAGLRQRQNKRGSAGSKTGNMQIGAYHPCPLAHPCNTKTLPVPQCLSGNAAPVVFYLKQQGGACTL